MSDGNSRRRATPSGSPLLPGPRIEGGALTRRPYADLVQVMKCSFCGQTQDDRRNGRRLIAGPGVAICSECVRLCAEILEAKPPEGAPPGTWWKPSTRGG